MNRTSLVGLIILLAVSVLSGCGGGDGEAAPTLSIGVTTSKTVALANGADAVTIQANVTNANGTAVPDGTVVVFSSPTATLSASTAATTNGTATVSMTRPPVSGANNSMAVVTAVAEGASGANAVKFINQPTSVEVSIAVDQAVAGLALLQFKLNNTTGATFDNADPQRIFTINDASGSLAAGNFDAIANSNSIGLVNATGFNLRANIPVIRATYAVAAGAGLPTFSVDATTPIIAKDPQSVAIAPQLTAADFVITTAFDTEL